MKQTRKKLVRRIRKTEAGMWITVNLIVVKKEKINEAGKIRIYSSNDSDILWHQTYGLIQDFTVEKVLEVLVDDKWVRTRMEMNLAREWYLVGTHTVEIWNMCRQEYRNNLIGFISSSVPNVHRTSGRAQGDF